MTVDGEAAKKEAAAKAKDRKRPRDAFIYGNYKSYYGYRIDRNMEEDPRLSAFKKEWFEGKDCLDIGCNQGLITIAIANKFLCRSILGIDIDGGLINDANRNLRKMMPKEEAQSILIKAAQSELSNNTNCSSPQVPQSSNGEILGSSSDAPTSREDGHIQRVSFRKENFVQSFYENSEKYDTILCLSVTKWIHMNWGDEGLIALFVKIWRFLRPGGLLLLEPQPWSSYKRKRRVSEKTNENFYDINLRPDHFRELLLDKIGFRSAEVITDSLTGSVVGFDRPIIAFYK